MQFFLDNIFLIAIALVSGGALIWPWIRNRSAGPALSTLDATRLINGKHAQVIDVRQPDAFACGSLPNAKNIPVGEVKSRLGELKKDKPVLIVCERGGGAGSASAALRAEGFGEVYVLAGGVAAWREAGLPVKT